MAEREASLPRATLSKIVKELLPSNIRCSNESRDLLQLFCIEFVSMITQECNDICENSNKKTISAEHVLEALEKLEFGDYIEEVSAALEEFKEASAKSSERIKRRRTVDVDEEEAARLQHELFASALKAQARATEPEAEE
eukprot:c3235_g1_i1.p1 GENE.c3235_g1_i1~~c3235_g1_i1.p1  ORF type:complete len:140 (+),score=28.42 c3235_g1_i1:55-474(+)